MIGYIDRDDNDAITWIVVMITAVITIMIRITMPIIKNYDNYHDSLFDNENYIT